MKSSLSSITIIGAVIAMLAKFFGVAFSESDWSTLQDLVLTLWPIVIGVFADFGTVWARIKATNFNVPFWKSKVFWTQMVSGLMILFAAFGADISALQGVLEKSLNAVPTVIALAGVVLSLIGRFKASARVASIVLLSLFCSLGLTSCGTKVIVGVDQDGNLSAHVEFPTYTYRSAPVKALASEASSK